MHTIKHLVIKGTFQGNPADATNGVIEAVEIDHLNIGKILSSALIKLVAAT